MAMVGRQKVCHMRPHNKEPEWSSICNNVLDQYLDDDDLFGFGTEQRKTSSSDDSVNLFGFSGASEQSNQTSGTSPIPSIELPDYPPSEAQQPKAKVPLDFWHKKLRALEQHAAASEQHTQKLRTTKSHPDFLSLGGYPSPPAMLQSPTGQSYSAQRSKSRSTANGKKPQTQRSVTNLRAVSRGRPTGVTKPPAAAAAGAQYSTTRKASASPSKMMNPSRFRAGFKNVWADRIESSPSKYELRLPSQTFPASPPHSGKSMSDSFAAFGSPINYDPIPGYEDQISPLAKTFRQARLYTPTQSPLLSPGSLPASSYFEAIPPLPSNPYAAQTVPLNDTAPLYPDRSDSLAANKIQSFDFGFSGSPDDDLWGSGNFQEPLSDPYISDPFTDNDPFGTNTRSHLDNSTLDLGLGISCDPTLISTSYAPTNNRILPSSTYNPHHEPPSPYYVPSLPNGLPNTHYRRPEPQFTPNGLPHTPHRRAGSDSPSPPETEPHRRHRSSSRRTSRHHRRTKSSNPAPRTTTGGAQGGFVNYTPQDCNKILSGVAPSGSSKTKARREKEALDKRRRLSQAAMKAVIEAGGDLDALTKAGLDGDLTYCD
ncbi:unnamed protein product [Zymoseptoria tritici ST99CH_1E4]|uniref:Developmental regulatory protein wetA n=1 Tax=Zymoseptoria tritici ST99CH_1E4 TaxID=1276532 RepID=A0A2H1FJW9_ZYMTR|nr:unnamed protein product [Zymoseptoria tritici ST99CH_1E4]